LRRVKTQPRRRWNKRSWPVKCRSRRDNSSVPAWFTRAVTASHDSRVVKIDGCGVHYLRWGDPALHVAAIDLAGCADSARRSVYTQGTTTAEMMGVLIDSGMFAADVPPTLVGHSAGAQFAVRAALTHGSSLLGVVAIDGLRYAALEKDQGLKILAGPRTPPRTGRLYASLDDAVARFRVTPPPLIPIRNDYVVDYIARHSYRKVEGG
jgi:pimeloyl-ACP methyl ester carboxylesterase